MAIGKKIIKDAIKKGIKRGKETVTGAKIRAGKKGNLKKIPGTTTKNLGKGFGLKDSTTGKMATKAQRAKVAKSGGKRIRNTAVGAATLTALGSGKRKKPKATEAAKVTFGQAFKKARKEGEGTKFTWNGKSYTAVTKDDLKKKGYDGNELKQYANNKGKARRPIKRIGQGIKKVLLGKDKKFGGDKGLIDFIRGPKSKAKAKAKQGTANKKQTVRVNLRGGGMATGTSRSRVTPGQKSAIFRGRPDMPNVMPDRTRGGVLDTAELAGKRKPGMKAGGMAVKKYKAGGLAKRGLGKAYMKSKR